MVLVPKVGRVGALYLASGTADDLTNEVMNEVNLTAEGRPRYTVYEITAVAKRYLSDVAVPVFTGSIAGTLSPYRIEYPGGRIYLTTALSGADAGDAETVVCTSGKYIPVTMCIGAMDWNLDATWETNKIMLLRDSAKRTIMKQKNWTATANLALATTCAQLTTALVGDNNDTTWTHTGGGTAGNGATGGYTVTYTDPGGATATLGIVITGNNIVVNLGRAASAINTTALAIVNLAGANKILQERGVTAEIKATEDGSGLVTEMAKANLAGGLNSVDYPGVEGLAVAVFYSDYDTDARWEGYTRITKADLKMPADGEDTISITFDTYGGPNGALYLRKS